MPTDFWNIAMNASNVRSISGDLNLDTLMNLAANVPMTQDEKNMVRQAGGGGNSQDTFRRGLEKIVRTGFSARERSMEGAATGNRNQQLAPFSMPGIPDNLTDAGKTLGRVGGMAACAALGMPPNTLSICGTVGEVVGALIGGFLTSVLMERRYEARNPFCEEHIHHNNPNDENRDSPMHDIQEAYCDGSSQQYGRDVFNDVVGFIAEICLLYRLGRIQLARPQSTPLPATATNAYAEPWMVTRSDMPAGGTNRHRGIANLLWYMYEYGTPLPKICNTFLYYFRPFQSREILEIMKGFPRAIIFLRMMESGSVNFNYLYEYCSENDALQQRMLGHAMLCLTTNGCPAEVFTYGIQSPNVIQRQAGYNQGIFGIPPAPAIAGTALTLGSMVLAFKSFR